ncbi:MAG TPA: alkaline phosphatase family protein [Chthoniobacteraceae bacterium]|nr:alkaline phosphatase family protein [Chthoniobacteraceae bacterium]
MTSRKVFAQLVSLIPFFAVMIKAAQAFAGIEYVIAISVDGGRGDFIRTFIETAPGEFPNLTRLRDQSAFTFNARCDYTESLTIPDHLSMLTGRPVRAPAGLPATTPHGVISDAPSASDTVHNSGVNAAVYKASIFDVVHDHALGTALYMGKLRLQICDRSWDATRGAIDTVSVDNGRDKIDFAMIMEASGTMATAALVANFVAAIETTNLRNFTFFHIADTDYAGHGGTWSTAVGSPYRNTMKQADAWIGQILDAVQNNAALAGKVAVILTADHGGGTPPTNHTDATAADNYTIPFMLMAPGIAGGTSIYNYFENRFDPGTTRPIYTAPQQPMRNGDVANVSAELLGLPNVTGSFMTPEFVKPLVVTRNANAITVTWPVYLTAFALEYSDDLAAGNWTTINARIVESAGQNVFTFTFPPPDTRFFRLRHRSDPLMAGAVTTSSSPKRAKALPKSIRKSGRKLQRSETR